MSDRKDELQGPEWSMEAPPGARFAVPRTPVLSVTDDTIRPGELYAPPQWADAGEPVSKPDFKSEFAWGVGTEQPKGDLYQAPGAGQASFAPTEAPTQIIPAAFSDVTFDESPMSQTQVLPLPPIDPRDAQREDRNRALGLVHHEEPAEPIVPFTAPPQRTTDKWHGALTFFLLRLVTAVIVGIHGAQRLMNIGDTTAYFSKSLLPQSEYFAVGVSMAECVIAGLLVLGLMTRVAGLLLVVVEAIMLAFFVWGKASPFQDGAIGFIGEPELLLAVVGVVFLMLGAGGWAFDAAVRRTRLARKEAKAYGRI